MSDVNPASNRPYSPLGTGKTVLAEAMAGSADAHLVATCYTDLLAAGHLGGYLKAMSEVVKEAIKLRHGSVSVVAGGYIDFDEPWTNVQLVQEGRGDTSELMVGDRTFAGGCTKFRSAGLFGRQDMARAVALLAGAFEFQLIIWQDASIKWRKPRWIATHT